MAIEMYCDRCEKLVDEGVNGGVRIKVGRREYVFHLCGTCQDLFLKETKGEFIRGRPWRVIG